jgi:Major Facilitator Superfamily
MEGPYRHTEEHAAGTVSDHSSTPPNEKANDFGNAHKTEHLEAIRTVSRVPNPNYYEQDGLRTYGDDQDHDHEPPVSFKCYTISGLPTDTSPLDEYAPSDVSGCHGLPLDWISDSSVPFWSVVFRYGPAKSWLTPPIGGIPPLIYGDIGGVDRWVWFILANLLALAAVCPFVGALSDLIGRRYVALCGAAFIVLGMIVCSTAQTMNIFICKYHHFWVYFGQVLIVAIGGMALAGVGAGINELTALAATSELAPTAKRGKYVAVLVFTIVPFCPSVLWAQLIAAHSSWRYVGLLCGLWAFIGLVMTAIFYFPPPRVNSTGLTNREIIAQIDWVGGFLSISGTILFIAGLVWGGYMVFILWRLNLVPHN